MRAEIISVGTELLLGHTINMDAAIVAAMLADLGFDLHHVQTVGDNPVRLAEALHIADERSDIIITTGGLGPTDDDLTKSTVAAFAGVSLVEDPGAAAALREYFGSRPMSRNQIRQAFVPEGAAVFHNSVGTAPGCALKLPSGGFAIMLPGPPAELKAMLASGVRPFLAPMASGVIHSTIVRTFGIGEGAAAERIADLMANANPSVAPYAHGGEMFVKITARAESGAAARAMCEPLAAEIARRLGDVVYGIDIDSLEAAALAALLAQRKTIAAAESCTGGLVAKRLTDLPGASNVFGLGLVTYANEAKEKILGIPASLISAHGAVSREVAEAMARAVRGLAQSDLGIGITGIAGPDGGTEQKPVGLVHIALDTPDGCFWRRMEPRGRYLGRQWTRERAASHALDMARRYLAGLAPDVEF